MELITPLCADDSSYGGLVMVSVWLHSQGSHRAMLAGTNDEVSSFEFNSNPNYKTFGIFDEILRLLTCCIVVV